MRVSSYLALVVIAFPVIVIIAHEGPVWSGHPLSHHSPRIGHHSLHKHGDGHAHNRNLERDYWGNRGGGDSGYGRAWNDAEAEHASHEHDSHLHDRGGSGWANGHEGEHHHEDVGHRHKVKGGGAKSADDAGGTRKYSYFTEGNGPDGLYRRGYYGSDGGCFSTLIFYFAFYFA